MHLLLSTENEFWLWHLSFKYFRKLYYVSKLPASLSTQSWWGMRNPNYNSHDIIFDKNVHCCRRGNCSQPTKRPSHWLLKVLMLSLVNMIIGFQVMFSLGIRRSKTDNYVNVTVFYSGTQHDYVEINDGSITERYNGSSIPGPFTSTGTGMVVRFHSSIHYSATGFLAIVCCSVDITSDRTG